jgi:hypothetical protein
VRYYKLKFTKADGSPMSIKSLANSAVPPGEITSLVTATQGNSSSNATNPAALNIEFDMPQYEANVGGSSTSNYIRVWGVGLQDLRAATNFNDQNLELSAGMAEGYPLATPSQRGLLVKGRILQAFGNWLGTDMTLDFYIVPLGSGSEKQPVNYTISGKKGEKMADVIQRTLKTALPPGTKIEITVRSDRTLPADEASPHTSMYDFAQKVTQLTQKHDDKTGQITDPGVTIVAGHDGIVRATEGDPKRLETTPGATDIQFQDLLGQVTWAEPGILTAKLVLRGDLHIGQFLKFPPGLSTVTAAAFSEAGTTGRDADNLTFSGTFRISRIHHWGNYRQADAMSWNTTVWCIKGPDNAPIGSGGASTAGTGITTLLNV